MAFLFGLFKRKPGGTFIGNFLRSTIPIMNFIPHLDDDGNVTSTGHEIVRRVKELF